MIKFKIFQKLLILLAAMLIPTTILFIYANHIGEQSVRETLETSASKQLDFSIRQLEQSLKQIETQTLLLANDPDIQSYGRDWNSVAFVEHLLKRKPLEEKLIMQNQANNHIESITVYWPNINESISTSGEHASSRDDLLNIPRNKWFSEETQEGPSYQLLFTYPAITDFDPDNLLLAVQVTLSRDYLLSVLNGHDASGNGQSFFLTSGQSLITNHTVEPNLVQLLQGKGVLEESEAPRLTIFKLDGIKYLVQSAQSSSLGLTLVSYIRLNEFLHPLDNVSFLVTCSLIFLLLTGIIISLVLYRNYMLPFGYLVRKIESLGSGNIKIRATVKANNEFDYLFERFNDMAGRIQSLIENVYEEKIRTREAEFKHLQSQIKPHFLYNCLFYIVSMAHKSPDAVISMAKNLSEFFRYVTRKAGKETTLADEIKLVESYLNIHVLRIRRLRYEIDVPPSMMGLTVPTLLLQPIVENAIVHGLESKSNSGFIRITGSEDTACGRYTLAVDDDGAGMSEEALLQLSGRMQLPHGAQEIGCGLWNVHQRLLHRYAAGSGVRLERNEQGGLKVSIRICYRSQGETSQ